MAARDSYAQLDQIQCAVDFAPILFNVSVGIQNRNISVVPSGSIDDFDPDRNLTHMLMRQFELISNDMTNLYVSIVGDALMSSVAAVEAAGGANGTESTLAGVENALTAMADDMLAGYAGAQLMVGGFSDAVLAVFVVNLIIVLVFLAEVMRTRGWRLLPVLDISDPKWLITVSYRGGSLAGQAAGSSNTWNEKTKLMDGEGDVLEKQEAGWRDSMVELRKVSDDDGEVALFLSRVREADA